MPSSSFVYLYYGAVVVFGILIVYSWLTKKPIKEVLASLRGRAGSGGGKSPTPFMDSFAVDFTRRAAEKTIDPVIGREDEVKRLSQVLSRRTKNNAILTGDPGVGKTAIVEGLAQRIARGEVPDSLKNKRVLALDVPGLLAGTKYRGEFENRAKKIVQEISGSHRSIILFIDEVHSIIQSQGSEGSVNFSDILKPALARGDLQMIGATTTAEYNKYIKTDSSLERRFQQILVDEATAKEAIAILAGIKDKYQEYHKVEFTDAALEAAVLLTQKHIRGRTLPDKAIDAIDEAAAMVRVSHLHESIPAVLYQAAVKKSPEIAKLWKQLQDYDREIQKAKHPAAVSESRIKREAVEKKLDKHGVLVVDADDVRKVVEEWAE